MSPWLDGLHSCAACGELTWSEGDLCYDCEDQSNALECGRTSPPWVDTMMVTLGVICALAIGVVIGWWALQVLPMWIGAAQ